MFDFHRHFTNTESINEAFYATSNINEWDKKAKFMSYGILPNNINLDINTLTTLLENNLKTNKAYHIGEIGLDNRFQNIEDQISFFEICLKLASKYNRILTIHIVGSNSKLLNLLEKNKNNLPKVIIYHGFSKSLELAKQLQKYQVIVSLNPKVLKTKLIKDIRELDKVGFLLESDWDKNNDDDYKQYFDSFVHNIEALGAINFKEVNNEFRTILENF